MPLYRYAATGLDGREVKGKEEAANPQELYKRLKSNELYLTSQKEVEEAENKITLKSKELSEFAHQLGTMLSSGINLTRALSIYVQRCTKNSRKELFSDLNSMVQQGVLLSDAMERKTGAFPPLMINMIRAGETSGNLDRVAMKLSEHYEKDNKLKLRVRSAMIYPCIVMCLTVGVVILIFTVIMPEFYDMFEKMENIPITTKILMGFSKYMTGNFLSVVFIAGIIIALLILLFKSKPVQKALAFLKVNTPFINKLMKTVYTSRFARGLSSLYSSGLSMIQSLKICAGLVDNVYVAKQFDDMVEDVKNGVPLSTAIARINGFDSKLASSVYVGEESGRIDSVLEKLANNYDYEAEQATQQLMTLLEPLMIIMMAAIVGTVMISVILPVYQYYQTLG